MDGQEMNVAGAEAQVSTIAEPVTQESTEPVNQAEATNEVTEVAETNEAAERNVEEDARFANVRRKAEADAKARYEAQTKSADDEFKRLFGSYKNPVTGKPIESVRDYVEAFKAQQKQDREEELRSKGVDPQMIEEMVNNSPIVQQANAVMQRSLQAEAQRQFANDLKIVSEIDPAIKTEEDLIKHSSYPKVLELVTQNRLSLPDAYKLANYAELSARNNAAVKQAAINQAKGKQHMEATGAGVAENTELVEVPASMMATYKQFYPNLTEAQIKAKYNEMLKNQ